MNFNFSSGLRDSTAYEDEVKTYMRTNNYPVDNPEV